MLTWLKERRELRATARSLYGSIVTQARRPGFYARLGVPDTAEGRFEMIALHLALVLRRLAGEGEAGHRLGQALTGTFVTDVDDTLREMTVGDMAVPRHVKRAVAAVYDRHAAYGVALDAWADEALQTALQSQLIPAGGAAMDFAGLGSYMREAALSLARQPAARLLAGGIDWPDGLGARGAGV
jgi:cytochrome b pre-mRNA-processing protein 3